MIKRTTLVIAAFALLTAAIASALPSDAKATVYVNQCNLYGKSAFAMAHDNFWSIAGVTDCDNTFTGTIIPQGFDWRCTRAGWHNFDISETDNYGYDNRSPSSSSTLLYEIDPGNGTHDVSQYKCTCGGGEIPGGCSFTYHVRTTNIGL